MTRRLSCSRTSFIKLNEIGYYYGEKVALQNSADLGQSISLGGLYRGW